MNRTLTGLFVRKGFSPRSTDEIQKLVKDAFFFIIETLGEVDDITTRKKVGWIAYYFVRSDYPYLYEIGYRTHPSERRKGYATEAAKLIIDFLFATKNIERIESVTDTENLPSQRVLEKNGFIREGVMRKRDFKKGQFRDEYMYSLLREEWQEPFSPSATS